MPVEPYFEFKEIIADLAPMEVKYGEEDMVLMMLHFLPSSCSLFYMTFLRPKIQRAGKVKWWLLMA